MTSATAKISRNGQVSLPAAVRHRWGAERVIVIDEGDRVIVRPVPENVLADLQGRYRDDDAPSSTDVRRAERLAERRQEPPRR